MGVGVHLYVLSSLGLVLKKGVGATTTGRLVYVVMAVVCCCFVAELILKGHLDIGDTDPELRITFFFLHNPVYLGLYAFLAIALYRSVFVGRQLLVWYCALIVVAETGALYSGVPTIPLYWGAQILLGA